METFEVDVVRTSFGVHTQKVLAENRLQAQDLALEMAGNYLYKPYHSAYALDDNNPYHEDEFSAMTESSLVMSTTCSNNMIAIPNYVQLPITAGLVREIKHAQALCAKHGFTKVTLACQDSANWSGTMDDGSASLKALGRDLTELTVTNEDFCVHFCSADGSYVVESIDITFDQLDHHIQSGSFKTVICPGTDKEYEDLLNLLEEDRQPETGSPSSERFES